MPYFDPELQKNAKKRAAEDFKNHKVYPVIEDTESHTWVYKCYQTHEGGSFNSTYYFQVIVRPGVILLVGDLGTLVIEPRGAQTNPLAWLASAYPSYQYIFEKVPQEVQPGFLGWDDSLALLAAQDYLDQAVDLEPTEDEQAEAAELGQELENQESVRLRGIAEEILQEEASSSWDSGEAFIQWLSEVDEQLWEAGEGPTTQQVKWGFYWMLEAVVWLCRNLGLEVNERNA